MHHPSGPGSDTRRDLPASSQSAPNSITADTEANTSRKGADDGGGDGDSTVPVEAYILESYESINAGTSNFESKSEARSGDIKCAKTRIHNADELRASIASHVDTDIPGQHGMAREAILKSEHQKQRRLLVAHGLSKTYVDVLLESPELDIDPYFIDAHVRRQSYRPLRRMHKHVPGMAFAHFDYPELIDYGVPAILVHMGRIEDIVQDPVVHPLTGIGGKAVVFCQASLWIGSTLDVLLLDRPQWTYVSNLGNRGIASDTQPTGPSAHVQRHGVVTGSADISSLETLLMDHIGDSRTSTSSSVTNILHDIAMRKWIEFFEAITLELPHVHNASGTSDTLSWNALQYLERNLEASHFVNGGMSPTSIHSDWERLIARLDRQIRMRNYISPPDTKLGVPDRFRRGIRVYDGNHEPRGSTRTRVDEDRRSLDRVTYLGGILLPISVVSGMLSMNDEYSPTGDMFFVFWAAAMPLCLITVLVIYADSIRKMEVWIEVATSRREDIESEGRSSSTSDSDREYFAYDAALAMPPPQLREQDECDGMPAGPGIIAEQPFSFLPGNRVKRSRLKQKKWKKQQLGWIGACKSIFHIYRLKDLRRPEPNLINPPSTLSGTSHSAW